MENCIFCKIISGDIPSATLYENDEFKIFLDLGPASKGHCLIVPKAHYANIFEMPDELLSKAFILAKKASDALMKATKATGINVVQNNGIDAGQTVFHFHIHLIPRYKDDDAGFGWDEKTLTDDVRDELLSSFVME